MGKNESVSRMRAVRHYQSGTARAGCVAAEHELRREKADRQRVM